MAGRKRNELSGTGARAELARRLRILRDSSGLTLRQAAAKSGYSQATLSAAESGRRTPSWEVTEAFVQCCGADPRQWRQLWELAAYPTPAADLEPAPRNEPASQPSPPATAVDPETPLKLADPGQPRTAHPGRPGSGAPRRLRRATAAAVAACTVAAGIPLAWWLWQALRTSVAGPASADIYGCVGADKPAALTLQAPAQLNEAGWLISHPVPWHAPQCENQVWWAHFTAGGATPGTQFTWIFSTAMPQSKACALWTYSPPPPSGHAHGIAHYMIEDGADPAARVVGRLAIDQAAHKGSWVSLGDYHFTAEKITIALDNDGTDASPKHGAVAGPIHVHCAATPQTALSP